jgi:PAS domain S-box
MTPTRESLRVAVLGECDISEELAGVSTDSGRTLATTTSTEGDLTNGVDADCLLVDHERSDEWPEIVTRAADAYPSVPVVALVPYGSTDATARALARGAASTLPRSVCVSDPDAAAAQVGTLVRGFNGGREQEDQRTGSETDGRWQLVADNVDEIIYAANWDLTDVKYVSPGYEAIWGRPVEELCEDATAFIEGIDARDREAFEADFQAMRADIRDGTPKERYEFEFRVRQPDGEVRWVAATGHPVTTDGGRRRYVGIAEDITERKKRERTVAEEREKYSTLVEQSTDGVVVVRDGEYVFVNEQFTEITGYDREELLGMNIEDVFTPESRELIRDRYERRVSGESPPNRYDIEVLTATGNRLTLELAVSRIQHESEPATMANFRDVTDRKERERAVEELQTAVEQLQGAETTGAVFDITVETTREVLGLPITACWRYDDEGRLLYVAGTEPVNEMEGGPVSFTPGDREFEAFVSGDATVYDPSEYHQHNPLDRSILVPVGDRALLAAGERGRTEYPQYLVDVMCVLASHTASALERVQRAEQLRESERRLGAIIDRIDEAIFLAPAAD